MLMLASLFISVESGHVNFTYLYHSKFYTSTQKPPKQENCGSLQDAVHLSNLIPR
jgi:hypothetical protein